MFILAVGLTQERQGGPVGSGCRFDHVRQEAFPGLVIEIGQILSTSWVRGLSVFIGFNDQFVALADELAFHVAPEIEVAAMGNSFKFAVFAVGQERECVFHVRGADGVVREFVGIMVPQDQVVAGNS